MVRFPVQSRRGNVMLALLGGIYALGAVVVLVLFVIDVGIAPAMIDLVLQVALLGAAACGVWFIVIAIQNLGLRHTQQRSAHR
jgi:hypothetical protein